MADQDTEIGASASAETDAENSAFAGDATPNSQDDLVDELQVIAAQPLDAHAAHLERIYEKLAADLHKQDPGMRPRA